MRFIDISRTGTVRALLPSLHACMRPLAQTLGLPSIPAHLPGLMLAAAIAAAGIAAAAHPVLQSRGIGALTLAIVIGMVFGNLAPTHWLASAAPGLGFAKQTLLRLGIVLYGLRIGFHDVAAIGVAGVLIDALVLAGTFALAYRLGPRLFGLDAATSMLVGAGSAICGAAAVMATAPVVRARDEQVAVAVATVVVFGTAAMFLYPALYALAGTFGAAVSPLHYGVYAGSTVHEVAQVVVAGRAVGERAADVAVVTKMVRVMMLAPFLLLLSAWLARRSARPTAEAQPTKLHIPWFALGFIAVAAVHSIGVLPDRAVTVGIEFDGIVLATAMAALGAGTRVAAIRRAGFRPLALAGLLFAWLIVGGLAINAAVWAVLG